MPKLNQAAQAKTADKPAPDAGKTDQIKLPTPDETPEPKRRNPTETPGLTFQTLDTQTDYVNMLMYGKEGSGKTTAAARMSNLGRVLVINAEGGLKRGALAKHGVKTENIAVYPQAGQPLTFDGLEQVYAQLRDDLANDPTSWAGVVLDSATEIYQVILEEVGGRRIERMINQGQQPDRWFTDIADYGTMSKQFRFLVRRLRDLPCHLVITALERRDVDEDTGRVAYGPAVSPALATDMMGYVDLVLVAKQAEDDKPFRALTSTQGKYRAKDRLGVLPKVLNEPYFDRVVAYVEGDLTEGDDPMQGAPQQDSPEEATETPKKTAARKRTAKKTTSAPKDAEEPRETDDEQSS